MYKKYNIIITDNITDTTTFFNVHKNTNCEIFEIISWNEELSLNWFTELTWNLWYLWDIQNNIPVFRDFSKRLKNVTNDDSLLKIAKININLIKNYFRNHILLKNIINNNSNIDKIKHCIINIITPVVLLINQFTSINPWKYINNIKNSKDLYEILLNFELLVKDLVNTVNSVETVLCFWSNISFSDYIKDNDSLHKEETKHHLESLKEIFKELEIIKEYTDTFLLYWSIARNETKWSSDLLDWIIVIKDSITDDYDTFQKTLSSIIKSNQILLEKALVMNKHPFHYMFQWDLNSYSPQYKTSFINKFKPIFWKDVIKIDKFFDKDIDDYFWKYAFFNTFQKLRNECWTILNNGWNFDSFCNELKSFMKKWFFLLALAANGIFVDENICVEEFKNFHKDLVMPCNSMLSTIQNTMLSKEDIIKILDFYYLTLKNVYNFE